MSTSEIRVSRPATSNEQAKYNEVIRRLTELEAKKEELNEQKRLNPPPYDWGNPYKRDLAEVRGDIRTLNTEKFHMVYPDFEQRQGNNCIVGQQILFENS